MPLCCASEPPIDNIDVDLEDKRVCLGTIPLLFPMYLIQVRDILEMTEVRPMQELREIGKVKEYAPGMKVIFVSHQWVGNGHPDPNFEQMQVLIDALKNISEGKLRVETLGFFEKNKP